MPAPRGIKLNEDVLLVVEDNLLVVVRDNDGDWAVLLLRDGLRLDAGLDLAGEEVVDELADGGLGELGALV